MKTEFARKFTKDLERIKIPKQKQAILEVIQKVKQVESLQEIPSSKRLVGFEDAYRIRVGDLRIGVFVEADMVLFSRVANRKDIYKIFP